MSDVAEITLNGRNEPFFTQLTCTHNHIFASPDSACIDNKGSRTQISSNKIISSPISNFSWPYSYYNGNNVIVHKDSGLLAYTLITNQKLEISEYQGKIRVFEQKFQRKCLINELYGNSLVMKFSSGSDLNLAVIDSFGILYVFKLVNNAEGFIAQNQLVVCPKIDKSLIRFAGLCWKKAPESNILIWSYESNIYIMDFNFCVEKIDESNKKITFDTLNSQFDSSKFHIIDEHTETISMISLSKDERFICSSSLNGCVLIHKFKDSDILVDHICKLQPQDDSPLYSCYLLSMDIDNNSGYLLTGSQYNQELVLTQFEATKFIHNLQHIVFKQSKDSHVVNRSGDSIAFKVQPQLIISLDDLYSFIFLSDIKRGVLYAIELGESLKLGKISFLSISEFLVNSPCISLEVTSVERELHQVFPDLANNGDDDSLVPLGGEACYDQRPQSNFSQMASIKAQIYSIQPTSLQAKTLEFKIPVWSTLKAFPLSEAGNVVETEKKPSDIFSSVLEIDSESEIKTLLPEVIEINDSLPENVIDHEHLSMMLKPGDFPVSPEISKTDLCNRSATERLPQLIQNLDYQESSSQKTYELDDEPVYEAALIAKMNGSIEPSSAMPVQILTPNLLTSGLKHSPSPSSDYNIVSYDNRLENTNHSLIVEPKLRVDHQPLTTGMESVLLEISAHMHNQSQMMENFIDSLDEQKRNLNGVCAVQNKLVEKIDMLEQALMLSDSSSEAESISNVKTTTKRHSSELISSRSISRNVAEILKQLQGEFNQKFCVIEQTLASHKNLLNRLNSNLTSKSQSALSTPMNMHSSNSQLQQLSESLLADFKSVLNNELDNRFHNLTQSVTCIVNTYAEKFCSNVNSLPSRVSDIVAKVIKKDKNLSSSIASHLQNTHKEIITKQIIPNFKEGINKLFVDLNTVFASGTKQYLQNTDLKFKSLEDRLYQRIIESQVNVSDPSIIEMKTGAKDSQKIFPLMQVACQPNLSQTPGAEKTKSTSHNVKPLLNQQNKAVSNNNKSSQKAVTVNQNKPNQSNQKLSSKPNQQKKSASEMFTDVELTRLMGEAHKHLQNNRPVDALVVALNSTHQPFLLDILRDIPKNEMFKNKIDQSVLLSLVNQLTCGDLKNEFDLKISYLQDSLSKLDKTDPITAQYVGPLMSCLDLAINQIIQDNVKLTKNNPKRFSDSILARLSTLSRLTKTISN